MSLRITKQGLLDTVQDSGRYGQQHLGINPDGAMDRFSAQLANALLGKDLKAPVIEIHFPAPQIKFEKETIICITGAHFFPTINGSEIPMHHPVAAAKNAVLKFEKLQSGARSYLAVWQDLKMVPWLNSYSTNMKAAAGGWQGRSLQKNDVIPFQTDKRILDVLKHEEFTILPWRSQEVVDTRTEIEFLFGSEWHWMTSEAQEIFQNSWFQITIDADRMGYKLAGPELETNTSEQLVSSAVSFGTVQLLPNGQLIVLMADHQTTGGYPRVAHVITAHLPILAQKKPNDVIQFRITDLETAEAKIAKQQRYLQQLQLASKFRMDEWLVQR
ncbi:MAG TPA: biotin-dependent carboxyltransferase family protein [Flavisolibacter sp.]|nr:biotin-dependent carboxyltransferase family protein [Flavisolibacter sp.]